VLKPLTTSTGYNGLGDLPFYTYVDSKKLTDQLSMKVYVANGNLLLNQSELNIQGTGLNLSMGSAYNSEDNSLLDDGDLWYFTTGRGITIDASNISNGITLHGPTGYSAFFAADGSGGFKDAPGLNASLKPSGTSNYTVTFHRTGEMWGFNSNSSFESGFDKNGHCVYFNHNGRGDLTSIVDTQKRTVSFTQGTDPNNDLHQVTSYTISTPDGVSKTITHSYNGFLLASVTNANHETTSYAYDSAKHITTITDPVQRSTSITYTSDGKVATVTDANGGVTTFTYNSGNTVVTDANGHATTYYKDRAEIAPVF
jgi:YD repeat-containing protein